VTIFLAPDKFNLMFKAAPVQGQKATPPARIFSDPAEGVFALDNQRPSLVCCIDAGPLVFFPE
jgi:hypothetical protein